MMDVFQAVRESGITMEAVAERCGLPVRGGKTVCPFHEDTQPSMFLRDNLFHCFGCGAGGDVITFISRLYGIKPVEAAKQLCCTFSIPFQDARRTVYEQALVKMKKNNRLEFIAWEIESFRTLAYIYRELGRILESHVGLYETEDLKTALRLYSRIGYFVNILTFGSREEKEELYRNHRKEVDRLVAAAHTVT